MRQIALAFCAAAFALATVPAVAQPKQDAQQQTQKRDQIYGSQLMTQQERDEYRSRMRAAKTDKEREQIRSDHHARMQDRAKERGVTLPDAPRARRGGPGAGKDAGAGAGMGPGMGGGTGKGMGPGMGGGPGGGR